MNPQEREALKQYIDRIKSDPLYFIDSVLGGDLWNKQKDILLAVRDNLRTAAKSCHGIGKSHIAASIALWFLSSFKNSIVLTTAPTFRQVEDILWRELHDRYNQAKKPIGGVLNQISLNIDDKWYAIGLSTNEPERFQGYHANHILIIVDEASGVDEKIFEAIEGNLSAGNAKLLLLGNPTQLAGTFYQAFKLPTFSHISVSAFETPNFTGFGITVEDIRGNTWSQKITGPLPRPYLISPEWVYDKYLRWGEESPMWQSRVMGDFPRQGDDTLIPLAFIEKAAIASLIPQESDIEVTGVDIARFGVDKTEFCYRKGPKVMDWKTYGQLDTTQTSGHLKLFMGFHPASQVNIDEVGIGAGVFDNIRNDERFKYIRGINVGLASRDTEMFFNLRAEIFWGLRQRFVDGEIDLSAIPKMILDDIMSQLASIKFSYTPKGQIKIENKEEMKKRGLPSPDKADALALAFYHSDKNTNFFEFMNQINAA